MVYKCNVRRHCQKIHSRTCRERMEERFLSPQVIIETQEVFQQDNTFKLHVALEKVFK